MMKSIIHEKQACGLRARNRVVNLRVRLMLAPSVRFAMFVFILQSSLSPKKFVKCGLFTSLINSRETVASIAVARAQPFAETGFSATANG
ncbi:MAG TPA: hypothetical protein VM870_09140 [Pyrinomonadaceae bacterium]|jgi:hypothetical protein|nr:hypothetical protein [Pyrinomonadaceae bacterium]